MKTPNYDHNDQMLRATEVAKLLGVCRTTVYNLEKDEAINFPTPLVVGNRYKAWQRRDICKWIQKIKI